MNVDREVAGIIVQQPLPRHIPLSTVTDTIVPAKDIDGIHPLNTGLMTLGYEGFLPACAEAAVEIPKFYGYDLSGKRAVVIGRSNVVGKPVQLLLVREHCTVTVCHRRTRNLEAEVKRAEVVVTAAGSPGLVTGKMLTSGALVIDVGINVVRGGIVGDVEFESASRVAEAITPVPGGVGPVTNAVLLDHLVRAAKWQETGHPILAGHGQKDKATKKKPS
jgi:methylenetetrahydrofolate dehydrogenase (NADP+)/methenyltetrahydrofolate cyclohydrolase